MLKGHLRFKKKSQKALLLTTVEAQQRGPLDRKNKIRRKQFQAFTAHYTAQTCELYMYLKRERHMSFNVS